MNTHLLSRTVTTTALVCGVATATAQTYPVKPIRFILPVAASSTSDTLGRLIARPLADRLGQQIVIDNQPGAGGNIGVPMAARAAPDGYTMVLVSSAQAISPSIYPKLSYDLMRDFAPVTQFTAGLYMLVVHPSVPARNVKELIQLARSRPGQLTFGSAGVGTGTHLTGELFKASAKVDLLHVPYRGMGPATSELLGGQLSVIFSGLPSGLPHMKSGRVRALSVTSASRSNAAPDLPTLSEAGLPGFESTTWQGLAVPAATPREIIARLHAESVKIVQSEEVRAKLQAMGTDPVGSTPEQFSAYIKSETVKWGKLIRDIGLRLE
jgi:tripartite-type tricarboxylate transporter receptor subunit TctC